MAVIEKIGGKFRGAQSSDPTADVLLDLLLAFGFVLSVFASGIGLLHGHALTFASILTFARVSGRFARALAFTRGGFFTLHFRIVARGECGADGSNGEKASNGSGERNTLKPSRLHLRILFV